MQTSLGPYKSTRQLFLDGVGIAESLSPSEQETGLEELKHVKEKKND